MGRGSGGGGSGLVGAAGAVLAAELCAPLLLLCGLCCWPDDSRSDTSSTGKPPQKPVVAQKESSRRRSSEVFSRRGGSSSASLHLPSTSGHKQPLSAHRSHEEIPSRRRSHSHLEPGEEDARYHSAPSVIDEVIHRRDWERSTKELYIPLKPDVSELFNDEDSDISSPAAPKAESESSSVECLRNDEPSIRCKKHYTNIKSSRNRTKKESNQDDVKDTDATENQLESTTSDFYIGEAMNESAMLKETQLDNAEFPEEKIKSVYKAKDAKQSFNESIKTKERPFIRCIDDERTDTPMWEGYKIKTVDMDMDLYVDELDRSRPLHHDASRGSLVTCVSKGEPYPPPSVEAVGWEGGACYLAEAGSLRSRARLLAAEGGGGRARHASDGDILAPTLRPESGAFSESDLELELEASEERPPSYEELQRAPRKETAI